MFNLCVSKAEKFRKYNVAKVFWDTLYMKKNREQAIAMAKMSLPFYITAFKVDEIQKPKYGLINTL